VQMTEFSTYATIAALMITAPAMAHAELRDVRDYWAMTCFPPRGAPYRVEVVKGGNLIITSNRGCAIIIMSWGIRSSGLGL
jgi:hypothetical protein